MQGDKLDPMRANSGTCLRMLEKENFPNEFAKMLIFKPAGTGGHHMGYAFLKTKQAERKAQLGNGIQGKIKISRTSQFGEKIGSFFLNATLNQNSIIPKSTD